MATRQYGPEIFRGRAGATHGGKVSDGVPLSTPSNTGTVIFSVPVAELEGVKINGSIIGMKSDASAMIDGIFNGGWRRAAAGNVTANGTPVVTTREDSGGTPTVAWNANTTAQTVELVVTGISAETWKWEAHYEYFKVKA